MPIALSARVVIIDQTLVGRFLHNGALLGSYVNRIEVGYALAQWWPACANPLVRRVAIHCTVRIESLLVSFTVVILIAVEPVSKTAVPCVSSAPEQLTAGKHLFPCRYHPDV
jgi:hypothetical protein